MATESAPPPTSLASGAGRALSEMSAQQEAARQLELELRDAILKLNDRVAAGEKPDLRELFPKLGAAFRAQRPDIARILPTVMGPITQEIQGNEERHEELKAILFNLGAAFEKVAKQLGVDLGQ